MLLLGALGSARGCAHTEQDFYTSCKENCLIAYIYCSSGQQELRLLPLPSPSAKSSRNSSLGCLSPASPRRGTGGQSQCQQQPLCPKQDRPGGSALPALLWLQGTGHSTSPAPQARRGQPGWVIQGTATLISSRITACLSEGAQKAAIWCLCPQPARAQLSSPSGLTQHSCSSGMVRAGNGQQGLAMDAWSTLHGTLSQPGPAARAGIQQQEPRA